MVLSNCTPGSAQDQAAVVTCAALGAAAGGLLVPGALVGAAAISYAAGITYTRYRYDRLREAQPDGGGQRRRCKPVAVENGALRDDGQCPGAEASAGDARDTW